MLRAVLCGVCVLLVAGSAAGQLLSGASHRLRGAHVSSGFTLAVSGAQVRRLAAGVPDPPGFGAGIGNTRAAALGFLATLVGGFPADPDLDGVHTFADNCPFAADPLLLDFDGDRTGDVCDPDDDNESLADFEETEAGSNPFGADTDGDGLSDFAEVITRGSNPLVTDTDGDGRADALDNCVSLANGPFTVPPSFQLIPGWADLDQDGIGDACDPDAKGKRFWTFESGPVRPLAVTPDGTRLLATNIPDNRLEIFAITPIGLESLASVPVGLEPVAVNVRSNGEAWVVNHLSDSVSVVSLADPPQVVRTLLVGDEPRDVVFAGPGGSRAFITTAHRGQNSPYPQGQYNVPSIGRADVWVFDANSLGTTLGGMPLHILTLFGDKPRALAVSPDGSRVYAAVLNSGNQTATVPEPLICGAAPCTVNGQTYPGGVLQPVTNHEGAGRPDVGLIVKYHAPSGQWRDELGRDWSNAVRFDLPDFDVFELDANATPPVQVRAYAGVGTTIYNLIANPVSGAVYASNTDARNEVRFEGRNLFAGHLKPPGVPASVRGHLHEARVTILQGTTVTPRHLNKHIPYGSPASGAVKAASLATPVGMAISANGQTLYVAAFGSSKIGVFDTTALANDTFTPSAASQISVEGGGPAGLALSNGVLYTLTRFSNEVVAMNAVTGAELDRQSLDSPEPATVRNGRRFLYDAIASSSNGEASCSSCHIFGDVDDLAWDLGDPDGDEVTNFNFPVFVSGLRPIHPLKGPMATQTLRGLARSGPLHWRGDRGSDPNFVCTNLASLECSRVAFGAFNVAFDGLLGRDEGPLTPQEMTAFTDFILEVTPPPNPIRELDNSLRNPQFSNVPNELQGLQAFGTPGTTSTLSCNDCHRLDPPAGFFGSLTAVTNDLEPQDFKITGLRHSYQKVGMFGMPYVPNIPNDHAHRGPQVRGIGFLHDGVIDTLLSFVSSSVFTLTPKQRIDLEAFMMVFDTDLAPVVGQQVTLRPGSGSDSLARASLLTARAQALQQRRDKPAARECDLVVSGSLEGESRGWLQDGGRFRSDGTESLLTLAALQDVALVEGVPLTFTCAPPGSGPRIALDRDEDGVPNFSELLIGNDPESSDSDGDGTADGAEDTDADRIPDARDNCLFAANVAQHDRGGLGTGNSRDGVGDACQCGDLTADGTVTTADRDLLAAHIADPVGTPLTPGAIARCRVDLASLACDTTQLATLQSALAGTPGVRIEPVCDAALP